MNKSTKENEKKPVTSVPILCSYDDDDDDEEEQESVEGDANTKKSDSVQTNKKQEEDKSLEDYEKEIEQEIDANKKLKKSLETSKLPSNQTLRGTKPSGLLGLLPPPKSSGLIKKDIKPATPSSSSSSSLSSSSTAKAASSSSATVTTSAPTSTPSYLLPRTLKSNSTSKATSSKAPSTISQSRASSSNKPLNFFEYAGNISDDSSGDEEGTSLPNASTSQYNEEDDDDEMFQICKRKKTTNLPSNELSSASTSLPRAYVKPAESEQELAYHDEELDPDLADVVPADDEARKRFFGNSKKSRHEPIQIVDVKANDIIGDYQTNLMKQMTDEYKPSSNRDYFSSGSKRKHQITYLAYVAKERDQELKNSWAQSKFNRNQSRMKYGF